jgi:hypothetical protein
LQKSCWEKWHAEVERAQGKIIYSTMWKKTSKDIIADGTLRCRGRREK